MYSGSDQLRDWMRRRGFTQADAARYLGWDQGNISVVLAGKRTLGLETALRVERLTGIPVEAWSETESDKLEIAVTAADRKRRNDK
jgi:plasmid maintenance system antidote protein VapI